MSGPIQFGGLASGLDTASIIQALVGAESVPIQLLENQKSTQQSKINLLGTFDGYIKDLQKKAEELSKSTGFLANSVSGDLDGYATFDSSGGAALGSYSLDIQALASADRWSFGEIADASADLAVDTGLQLNFGFDGQSYELSFDPGAGSLNEIAERINTETEGAIKASVVQTGTEADPGFVLMLEGSKTGESYAIENLEVISEAELLQVDEQLTAASNAIVEFNGLTLERESNEFTDVVPGLSFTIESLTDGPIDFSVSVDDETVLSELNDFVDSFNQVIGFINSQSTFNEDSGPGGALFGDSVLRSVQTTLRSTLFGAGAYDFNSEFGSLGQVGISLQTDGTLLVDEAKLKAKLTSDPEAFADLFVDNDGFDNGSAEEGTAAFYQDTSADSGLFTRLVKGLEALLDSQTLSNGDKIDGLIDARKKTLQSNIERMDDRIEGLEFRLEKFEERLVQQYANLESILAGLQSQGAALGGLQSASFGFNNSSQN